MTITLSAPKEVTVVQEVKKTVLTITVFEVTDSQESKVVRANTLELGSLVLWQGATYDSIGQWTDTDVENRILEIINQ